MHVVTVIPCVVTVMPTRLSVPAPDGVRAEHGDRHLEHHVPRTQPP